MHVARTGHLIKTYPALPRCQGIAGPLPDALGNRDLVVMVGAAPVNLAGLKIGDRDLGDRATGEDFGALPTVSG